MVEYSKINCKLTNLQLNKLKKAVKSNVGLTLRLSTKNFNKNEVSHELLLTTRQNTKLRNALNNNSATDIKLSKAQIKKINLKMFFWEYSLIINKHNQKLINMFKTQMLKFI